MAITRAVPTATQPVWRGEDEVSCLHVVSGVVLGFSLIGAISLLEFARGRESRYASKKRLDWPRDDREWPKLALRSSWPHPMLDRLGEWLRQGPWLAPL